VLVRTVASLISAGLSARRSSSSAKGWSRRRGSDRSRQGSRRESEERRTAQHVCVRARQDGRVAGAWLQRGGHCCGGCGRCDEFQVGDRLRVRVSVSLTRGSVVVPKNLCVHLPESVSFESALTARSARSLCRACDWRADARRISCRDRLGLVGQLTVQLLKANGCRVFGLDLDQSRVCARARAWRRQSDRLEAKQRKEIETWTRGHGADAVLITAATDSISRSSWPRVSRV
jgi:polar amino acid transport system substrate-binding protein